MLDNMSVENVENGEFKNLLKLHQKVKNTLQKKIEAIEHYENMIDLNILQLTRRITSQNSMLKNIYGSTKKAMSDFEHSDKDYLFLDTNIGYLIIMRNFINLREWERSGVLITKSKKIIRLQMKLIQVVLLKNVIGCIERIQIVKKEYIPLFHQMIYVKNLTPSHFIKYIFYMLKHNLNLMEEQKVF